MKEFNLDAFIQGSCDGKRASEVFEELWKRLTKEEKIISLLEWVDGYLEDGNTEAAHEVVRFIFEDEF